MENKAYKEMKERFKLSAMAVVHEEEAETETPFESYMYLLIAVDFFIRDEEYEWANECQNYLIEDPVMIHIAENFKVQQREWAKNKII